jgi:CheY-like chemotaxis protein
MKILLVEDDAEYVDAIKQDMSSLNAHCDFVFARSRDAAYREIEAHFFDLLVLDLKLPTTEGAGDAQPEHGHSVFAYARERSPGTPIFVLTGSPAEAFVEQMRSHIQQIDIWGSGVRLPTVDFLAKFRYGELFKTRVGQYLSSFNSIYEVELDRGGLQLSREEGRLLRIFPNGCGAVHSRIDALSGGLSGVSVLRMKLTDAQGAHVHDAVCKIGARPDVFDESARFDQHISRLDGHATPRKLNLLEYGGGKLCGVFYGLAAGFDTDAFRMAVQNSDASAQLVERLGTLTAPWRQGQPQRRTRICDVRRQSISDEKFDPLRSELGFDWVDEFEARQIQVIEACTHGDLHGGNVLVASASNTPLLIDFGDVGTAAASIDPITLELSLLFHTAGPLRDAPWPSDEQCRNWGDLATYLVDCPCERFIRACREWARDVAAGNRELAAVAYSYLSRQLKYPEVNRGRALALLQGAKNFFDVT